MPMSWARSSTSMPTASIWAEVRTDENALWSLAPHDISVLNYLIGEGTRRGRVRAVSAICKTRR